MVATYCETRARSTGRSDGTSNARARCSARSAAPSSPITGTSASGEERLQDLAVLVLVSPTSPAHAMDASWRRISACSCRSSGPGSIPSSSTKRVRASLIGLERLGLAPRAVEREHQLAAERLAQRVLADERLELADHVAVPPELEIGVDALPQRDEPELLEAADLRLREVLEARTRRAAGRARARARAGGARAAPAAVAAARP